MPDELVGGGEVGETGEALTFPKHELEVGVAGILLGSLFLSIKTFYQLRDRIRREHGCYVVAVDRTQKYRVQV